MNVEINLPVEIESQLRRKAAAAGIDVGSFVKQIVTERLSESQSDEKSTGVSPDDFAVRQAAWVKLFPVLDHVIDDSRESFYEGRE